MNISDSKNQTNECTGCGICAVVCPKKCISVRKNNAGFFEASVDETHCINCGLCKKFCYKYMHYSRPYFGRMFSPLSVYGVWSKDKDLVMSCSSGGFATELSRAFFEKGYKICGVAYDYNSAICKHSIAESENTIDEFTGSKYLQSFTVDAFSRFKSNEKYIVFGSPCQIFGIRQYIKFKKIEQNFILIDFYCHGVPSYNLWTKYIGFLKLNGIQKVDNVNFVSKRKGWHDRSILVNKGKDSEYSQSYKNDLFGIFFGGMYCHNAPCFRCIFRKDKCYSDIRIADFWGKRYNKNQSGVNLIAINTTAGETAFGCIRNNMHVEIASNKDLKNSKPWRFYKKPICYSRIKRDLQSNKSLHTIYTNHIKQFLFLERNLHRLNRIFNRLFNL